MGNFKLSVMSVRRRLISKTMLFVLLFIIYLLINVQFFGNNGRTKYSINKSRGKSKENEMVDIDQEIDKFLPYYINKANDDNNNEHYVNYQKIENKKNNYEERRDTELVIDPTVNIVYNIREYNNHWFHNELYIRDDSAKVENFKMEIISSTTSGSLTIKVNDRIVKKHGGIEYFIGSFSPLGRLLSFSVSDNLIPGRIFLFLNEEVMKQTGSEDIHNVIVVCIMNDGLSKLSKLDRTALLSIGSSKINAATDIGTSFTLIGQKHFKISTPYEFFLKKARIKKEFDVNTNTTVEIQDKQETELTLFGYELPLKEKSVRQNSYDKICGEKGGVYRKEFCSSNSLPSLEIKPAFDKKGQKNLDNVPIIIMCGDRTDYLIRSLYHILKLPGLILENVFISVDGIHPNILLVSQMFGIKSVFFSKTHSYSNMAKSFRAADKIAIHYNRTFHTIFERTRIQNAIILEDDLQVAPDFLSYFSQTLPLLEEDDSLFCISAWNDNAYVHTSADPGQLYRSEFFPGLGWLLTRKLWKSIKPKWPKCCKGFSWDLWLRHKKNRRSRECIMPDVSRTFHFGKSGANVNNDFYYAMYFMNHKVNDIPYVRLNNLEQMKKWNYEQEISNLFKSGTSLNTTNDPCKVGYEDYFPKNTSGHTYIMWLQQHGDTPKEAKNDYKMMERVLSCWEMWDLGRPRGLHKGIIRFHINNNNIIMVGNSSIYAKTHLPKGVIPIKVSKVKRLPSRSILKIVKQHEHMNG